jgi:hypothetical protein
MPESGPAARANADRAGIWTRIVPDTRLRRRRQCELIWRLGARVFFELIDELDRRHGLGADLDARLARYARLDPEIPHRAAGATWGDPARRAEQQPRACLGGSSDDLKDPRSSRR